MKHLSNSRVKQAKRPSNINNSMKILNIYLITLLMVLGQGCAYYNTMFNAEKRFTEANTKLETSADRQVTTDIKNDYQAVIDKCWKLINIHGDDSNYADDAFLLIGKSYFQMEDYVKAERFLNQFTLKYPDSDLLLEGYLWLGRSQIKLELEDEAKENLNKIIADDRDDEFIAIAWFSLGELEQKNESYENAINNYQQCINYTGDEILTARALFIIGEILFESKEFDPAIDYYEDVLGYDISDEFAFEVQMQKVKAMLTMNDPEAAISVLYNMQRDSRYLKKESLIDARLGDCYAKEEEYEDAAEQYQYVLDTYPRTEGSSNAAYGFAELMETEFADMDSAKKLYDRVKQEYRNSDFVKFAGARGALIGQYLKIKSNIASDLEELRQVQNPPDTSMADVDNEDDTKTPKKASPKLRSESEIQESLNKNKFALAEYFLLSMQNYDSARVAYHNFTETRRDSALIPKAKYSLAYIYKYHYADSIKADEIHKEILAEYPDSPYAAFLLDQQGKRVTEEDITEDAYKEVFLQGEQEMYDNNYDDALETFLLIAEDDSGSIWAEKSRYAIAWMYEIQLDSIDAAIEAYEIIVSEYPNTEYARIARNKIKPPPEEKTEAPTDSLALSDSVNVQQIADPEKDTDQIGSEEDAAKSERIDKKIFNDEVIDNSRNNRTDPEEKKNLDDD
jgi:TolA-binding protein